MNCQLHYFLYFLFFKPLQQILFVIKKKKSFLRDFKPHGRVRAHKKFHWHQQLKAFAIIRVVG